MTRIFKVTAEKRSGSLLETMERLPAVVECGLLAIAYALFLLSKVVMFVLAVALGGLSGFVFRLIPYLPTGASYTAFGSSLLILSVIIGWQMYKYRHLIRPNRIGSYLIFVYIAKKDLNRAEILQRLIFNNCVIVGLLIGTLALRLG